MQQDYRLEAGSTISHFRLEKKLGEGGMGSVFLAEDLTLSRRVAIKFMSREVIGQQASTEVVKNLEQRFIREARSAAAINHPNVAQIYEANFETDNWYIVMELITGEALSGPLEKGKSFSVEQVVQILAQAVGGLKFAWDHFKIVHRDIKPQNIMMTASQQVKIVDLGLAKPLATAEAEYAMPELTGAGIPLGTPQYMAPEQAAGDTELDFRADIFALGATMYELLTGKKAFAAKTAPMIYIAQMKKEYIPLREACPACPAELEGLLAQMLEPNASNRIGSYEELLSRLNAVCTTLGIHASGNTPYVTASGTIPLSASKDILREKTDMYPVDSTIINRYKVIKHLGQSRAGIVYLCIDTETKRDCAVKSLMPGREFPVASMDRIRSNFLRLQKLHHRNLVAIDDVHLNQENGELLVCMELLRGQNLRQYTHHEVTRHGSLQVETIAPVLQRVARALDDLAATFSLGHGDIKPESIYLVNNDSEVKLLDYGITEDPDCGPVVTSGKVTIPLASPDYMAPERWRGEPLTPAGDQYSLAVTVYEMLARRLPFWLKDEVSTTTQLDVTALSSEQDLLKSMNRRVLSLPPPALEGQDKATQAAINQALAKKPEERFDSSSSFIASLCGVAVARPTGKGRSRKMLAIAACLVVVLLALVAAIMVMNRTESEERPTALSPRQASLASTSEENRSREETGLLREQVVAQLADFEKRPEAAPYLPELRSHLAAADAAADRQEWALAQSLYEQTADAFRKSSQQVDEVIAKTASEEAARQEAARLAALQEAAREEAAREEAARLAALQEAAREEAARQEAARLAAQQDAAREEAARQEAARLAALQEQLKGEAQRLQATAVERLATLQNNARTAELPELTVVRSRMELASEHVTKAEYGPAVTLFKQAIEAGHEVENAARRLARDEAEKLQTEVAATLQQIAAYAGLDPAIDELRAKRDVSLALARDAMAKETFDFAITQFQQVLDLSQQIHEHAARYRAEPGRRFTLPKVGIEMTWIEPLGMWVSTYELTNGQYRKFKPNHTSKKTEDGFNLNGENQPVCWITYYDAIAYCAWLNATLRQSETLPAGFEFRLPTADEWKELARCGQERLYPWGNTWPPTYGNFGNQEMFPQTWELEGYTDEFPATCDVTLSGKNDWGLYGIAGNVWEWTTDEANGKRAVYGASWSDVLKQVLVINIKGFNYADPSEAYDNIGCRLLLAPVAVPAAP